LQSDKSGWIRHIRRVACTASQIDVEVGWTEKDGEINNDNIGA
jgi:hypothetical protein